MSHSVETGPAQIGHKAIAEVSVHSALTMSLTSHRPSRKSTGKLNPCVYLQL